MPQYSASDLRETLQDRDRFEKIAEYFISKTVEEERKSHLDDAYLEYLEGGLKIILAQAISAVFAHCESPIEKVFVNSVFLGFIKAEPLGLVVTAPLHDTPRDMTTFREYHSKFCEFTKWYRERHGSLAGVEEYLDSEVVQGKMEKQERDGIWEHTILYEYLGLFDRFHLSLQPRFPELVLDGSSVRADMLIWVPANERVKIVVECDGYQFHSDKAAFQKDRRRDRLFKAHGFDVIRYSGSEIHKDPIGTSTDLFEFLEKQEKQRDGEQSPSAYPEGRADARSGSAEA